MMSGKGLTYRQRILSQKAAEAERKWKETLSNAKKRKLDETGSSWSKHGGPLVHVPLHPTKQAKRRRKLEAERRARLEEERAAYRKKIE